MNPSAEMASVDTQANEAKIRSTGNVLVLFSQLKDQSLAEEFCGQVITIADASVSQMDFSEKTVYLCGDISKAGAIKQELTAARRVFVIGDLSSGIDETGDWRTVDLGRVPVSVHGVGIFYRRFFDTDIDYFHEICTEHAFQSLTESTKPGTALRTGVYLTPVDQIGEDLHFNLLRCSTNLSGPTENFRANDRHIVDALNLESPYLFRDQAPLNHVLAQVYHNTPATEQRKQTKAKIKSHADKTKDMPENGIMAFCTFYDGLDRLQPIGDFDYGYKKTSGLTTLHFRLKPAVAQRQENTLPDQFTVTLYPNSVFFMPLSTNRLYTHEIRPAAMDAEKLPTRLGYVVRCSSTKAVHKEGQTFLEGGGRFSELEAPTPEGVAALRSLYAKENKSDEFIDYGNNFKFSMNKGDYSAPNYNAVDEFRSYSLKVNENLFEELQIQCQFEDLGKGRKGAVLVGPDKDRGVPIVRTTSRFNLPSQCFGSAHWQLAKEICKRASLPTTFNNALIETYTNAYASMGFHSDLALDLEGDSCIAVFSCYKYPEKAAPPRMLVIEPKEPSGGESFEIPLNHGSVVVFSLDTNRRFKHKIVLDKSANPPENQWLGVTFRTSKTFVQFREGSPYFEAGTPLALADEFQRKEFYSLRGRENKEIDFSYPPINYTISESDRVIPIRR